MTEKIISKPKIQLKIYASTLIEDQKMRMYKLFNSNNPHNEMYGAEKDLDVVQKLTNSI